MKNSILFLILSFFLVGAAAQSDSLTANFDTILEEQFDPAAPGVTVLVAKDNRILYHRAFGMANLELNIPMQVDHVFRIGSITKQFTAVAILQLAEQGKLSLQDNITRFIPDYPTQGRTITIEHLLTHTSGIRSYTSMQDYMERMTLDLTPEEMIGHFSNEPMEFDPGTQWNYSNSGYFLLGYIIEKASGQSYDDYLQEHLFTPAGMTHTVYGSHSRIIPNRAGTYSMGAQGYENASPLSMTQPYAAGSIMSTVEDLYKWNQAIHSYRLISKESLAKALTPYKLADGTETNYGYGWQLQYIQESPTIEHGGGINGSLTFALYLPEEKVFVAIFSNCDCYAPEDLAAQLAAMTIGQPYGYDEIPIDTTVLQDYTGVYENASGEQRIITVSEGILHSQRGSGPKFPIKPYAKDRFFFDDAMLTITFSRTKKGTIDHLTTKGRHGSEIWARTDKPIPVRKEIRLDETILKTYTGEYELSPDFSFVVTLEDGRIFIQASGQEKFEIFAESENRFFAKVVDAQFEFVTDDAGQVTRALLFQGGRTTEAVKIK